VEVIGTELLEIIAEVAEKFPISEYRWILAHVESLDDRQFNLVREHGLCVTTHTNGYLYKRGAMLRDRLGAAREHEIAPLRRLIDGGVPVSLATDNVPVSMWHPIWQVVARIDRTINAPIAPDQALSREEAIQCATMGGAFLTFEEDIKGSLEPGKVADLVVLSQDPLTCDLEKLRHTVAEITVVDGEVVYSSTQL
jgi:predicted amidohydrolase YtcJ